MIDNIRSSKDIKQALEFLDALKAYGQASEKTVRRAERAVVLKEKELNKSKKAKKKSKKKSS